MHGRCCVLKPIKPRPEQEKGSTSGIDKTIVRCIIKIATLFLFAHGAGGIMGRNADQIIRACREQPELLRWCAGPGGERG